MFVCNHMALVSCVIVIHTDRHVHRCTHTRKTYIYILYETNKSETNIYWASSMGSMAL